MTELKVKYILGFLSHTLDFKYRQWWWHSKLCLSNPYSWNFSKLQGLFLFFYSQLQTCIFTRQLEFNTPKCAPFLILVIPIKRTIYYLPKLPSWDLSNIRLIFPPHSHPNANSYGKPYTNSVWFSLNNCPRVPAARHPSQLVSLSALSLIHYS